MHLPHCYCSWAHFYLLVQCPYPFYGEAFIQTVYHSLIVLLVLILNTNLELILLIISHVLCMQVLIRHVIWAQFGVRSSTLSFYFQNDTFRRVDALHFVEIRLSVFTVWDCALYVTPNGKMIHLQLQFDYSANENLFFKKKSHLLLVNSCRIIDIRAQTPLFCISSFPREFIGKTVFCTRGSVPFPRDTELPFETLSSHREHIHFYRKFTPLWLSQLPKFWKQIILVFQIFWRNWYWRVVEFSRGYLSL